MSQTTALDRLVGETAVRFGRELLTASCGMPQHEIARRSGVSQSLVSRILRGLVMPDLELMIRLSEAVGHRFTFKLFPQDGVRLRDSGQLELAELIRSQAHPRWRMRLEVPIGRPPDRRAADMVVELRGETSVIELERGLHDFQAQLRAAQLKRLALVEQQNRPVNLVIGVPDTASARRALAPHATLIRGALPVSSRSAWAAIRSGEPIGGDALLWIRRRQGDAGHASSSTDGHRPATSHAAAASSDVRAAGPVDSDASDA